MTSREMREWRRMLGLTQHQAAEALGVGERTLRAWEGSFAPIPQSVAFACQWLLQTSNQGHSDG